MRDDLFFHDLFNLAFLPGERGSQRCIIYRQEDIDARAWRPSAKCNRLSFLWFLGSSPIDLVFCSCRQLVNNCYTD